MKYLIPYAILRRDLMAEELTEEQVIAIVGRLLGLVPVDEEWYLNTYPDIDDAKRSGVMPSAKAHFVTDGYYEGRVPFDHDFDQDWYLTTYPDVVADVQSGGFSSARDHYVHHGYAEGRLPCDVKELDLASSFWLRLTLRSPELEAV